MNHEHDVLNRLVDYHDHISAPPVSFAEDLHRGRRRVRRNRGLRAGALAIAAVAAVAAVTRFADEPPADPPQPVDQTGLSGPLLAPESLLDVRELAFHVEPVPDVVPVDSWAIEQDLQSTDVYVGDAGVRMHVAVYYRGRSPQLWVNGTSEAVDVNGAAGTYAVESLPTSWEAQLSWEYAPDSWAVVSARGGPTTPSDLRSTLLTVAEAIRSGGGVTVAIPVRLGPVPASLPPVTEAHGVTVDHSGDSWSMWLTLTGDVSLWATSQTDGDICDGGPATETFTYRGYWGCLVDGERIGLRLGAAQVFMDYGAADPGAKPSTNDMKQLLAELTVASADPATWFDLKSALVAD